MQEAQKIEIVSAKSAPLLLVSTILDDQKKETDSLVLETSQGCPVGQQTTLVDLLLLPGLRARAPISISSPT